MAILNWPMRFEAKPNWGELTDLQFAGNLNVFVDRREPIERHEKQAVGILPGRPSEAMFCVGDCHPDWYTFSVGSCEPGWKGRLSGAEWDRPKEILTDLIFLLIEPPSDAVRGRFSVLVRRHSFDKTVPIEFDLEVAPDARCRTYGSSE